MPPNLGNRLAAPTTLFEMSIDGVLEKQALIKSVADGMVKANVVEEVTGGSPIPIKHTTSREQEPINIEAMLCGTGLIWKWAEAAAKKQYARHNGAITHADSHGKSVAYQEFHNALIEEFTLPKLDANAKELATVKVKIRPEYSTLKYLSGVTLTKTGGIEQRAWGVCNFRLSLDDIDQDCLDCVEVIESFTIKWKIKPVACGSYMGQMSLPELEPVGVVWPNLKITIGLADAHGLVDWYNQMRAGKNDRELQKNGRIEFLDEACHRVLGFITLHDVGINSMSIGKSDPKTDAVKVTTFELFVSYMEFGSVSGEFWSPMA